MPNYKKVKVKQHASNYNYKGKRSFGQKLKNFFTIPEEDLKEEESPKFERIKLFRLNQGVIFLSILVFMLIINALIIFDVNFLHLRQILGFLFIILVPGLLIMLCFKIRTLGFWEYLVYTVGLSVAFIMFAGLAVNWTLPWLGITDKPLSLWPILICFNIFLLILWFIAIQRNKDLKPFDVTIPKLDNLNKIFFIIPMAFPLLSILGAFLLNNHGPNILTMIMLGGIAVYVLLLTIFRKKLDKNIWPWALYWMGLGLLLMFSMRSWFVFGFDTVSEYTFFNLAVNHGVWNITNYPHAYNVCLSVNILPAILDFFINVDNSIIFKIFIQIFFSFTPVLIYLLFKKISNNFLSFLAVFFFISQIAYSMDMPSHIRQEIAFLFLGLMFLALFTTNINLNIKKVLFVLFGVSMIVSHYSTSYVALGVFTLTYLFISLYRINENKRLKKGIILESQKYEFYLTGALVLLLLVFGFLWYSQITPTSSGLIDFASKSISNFNNLFDQDLQIQGQSFLDQFKLKPTYKDYTSLINENINEDRLTNSSNFYPDSNINDISIRFIPQKSIPSRFSYKFLSIFYLSLGIIKKLGYILILLGLIYYITTFKKRNDPQMFLLSIFGLISFSFVVLITLAPFGSMSYGVLRLYQQGLIIMSLFCILGANLIFNLINKKIRFLFILLFLIIYFFSFSGLFNQLIGGNIAFSNLNNAGINYDVEYTSHNEMNSIEWMSNNKIDKKVYASTVYNNNFKMFWNLPYSSGAVFPQTLDKNSYVYAGDSETYNSISFTNVGGVSVGFNFPKKFIDFNKNNLYSNGGSEIFK